MTRIGISCFSYEHRGGGTPASTADRKPIRRSRTPGGNTHEYRQ
jgi:hypothetical protein